MLGIFYFGEIIILETTTKQRLGQKKDFRALGVFSQSYWLRLELLVTFSAMDLPSHIIPLLVQRS